MKMESTNPLIEQIAVKIVEIVRSRTLREGDHLTEESFAAELGISRSPVRKAFALLNDYKIVTNEPNRGYFLNPRCAPVLTLAFALQYRPYRGSLLAVSR